MIDSIHPAPELRRQFARVARSYVAAMDAYTKAIKDTADNMPETQARTVQLFANKNRRSAYDSLIDAAVMLARAEGRL